LLILFLYLKLFICLMKLQTVRVQSYKSIIDSGTVEIESKITTLVGMTEAGKSSFLRMLSGIDKNIVFQENELPNGSNISQKFTNNEITAKDILQLTVTYVIEESDKNILPNEFKNITGITIKRYFDVHFDIEPIGEYQPISFSMQKDIENLKQTTFTNLKEVDISIQSLNNVINTIPKDAPLQNDFNLQINELNN